MANTKDDMNALAAIAFAEADKSKDAKAEAAPIMHAIINRANDSEGRWPSEIRAVIEQPNQFKGYGSEEWQKAINGPMTGDEKSILKKMVVIASGVLRGAIQDPTEGANHYFNGKKPSWAKGMEKTFSNGSHDFYRG